ncbi:uncharacterized protein cracdla [Menidia menidia]
MEYFSGDKEGSTDYIPKHEKPKRKSLKARLFRMSKRTGDESPKLSQSASDITAGEGLDSDDDLESSEVMMGSRALSHESIFLADEAQTDTEPTRILSQENVHSKIKALQMKLQLQKMHFGPPTMALPVRNPEGGHSEDSIHWDSHDTSGRGLTLTKTTSQPASCSLSPILKFAPNKSLPPTPSHPFSLPGPLNSSSSNVEAPLDFSKPVKYTRCLDNSAARHRMSVKPKNQRATTKRKPSYVGQRSSFHTINNTDHQDSIKEKKQELHAEEELLVTFEEAPKNPIQALPQTGASQAPWATSHSPVDPVPSGRPNLSFIEAEIKGKKDSDMEKRVIYHDKTNTLKKAEMTDQLTTPDQFSSTHGSVVASRLGAVNQHLQDEDDTTRGIKRPVAGSGSFHSSANTSKKRHGERPQSGSFSGELEQTETRLKVTGETEEKNIKERQELRSTLRKANSSAVGGPRQEGAPTKIPAVPWDRKESLKKVELVAPSKNIPTDTGALEAVEVDGSQEQVEEAEEAREVQEEEGKTAFGVKLRATSQSVRLRSETTTKRHSRTEQSEDQTDTQKYQEKSENVKKNSERFPGNTSSAVRPTDPVTSGNPPPVKHNAPLSSLNTKVTEAKTSCSNQKDAGTAIKEPESSAQSSSSEASWISLAMEKTRSLQQLFTSRFPRDFTGAQTAAQPQAHVQPTNQTEESGPAKQASVNIVREESFQSRGQAQTVKLPTAATHQKTAEMSPLRSRESQISKQPSDDQAQTNITQPVSQSVSPHAVQTVPWTTQSPLRSSSQTATTSNFAQRNTSQSLAQANLYSGQQQPSWSNRGVQPATQLKPTAAASVSPAAAHTSGSALESAEKEATLQKEVPSLSIRRAVWTGSVTDRAAFMEKRGEGATTPILKGVELRKAQIEMQTSGDAPSSPKNTPVNKDSVDGRQEVKPAESSPTKVLERLEKLREEKWLQKNVGSSSPPPSPPTQPSVLQSMSDSSQPSWMELAKRKSMAWSDKTMD